MAGRSHANPFRTSARTRRQYKQAAGCLTAPFAALFKGRGKRRNKKRRRT